MNVIEYQEGENVFCNGCGEDIYTCKYLAHLGKEWFCKTCLQVGIADIERIIKS